MRIGVEPTSDGVRAKRQHYRVDSLIRVCWRYRFDDWFGHAFVLSDVTLPLISSGQKLCRHPVHGSRASPRTVLPDSK